MAAELSVQKREERSGAELSIAALVTLLDLATTNNTISIITAGPIAKDISQKYGVSPVRAASILTCSPRGQRRVPLGRPDPGGLRPGWCVHPVHRAVLLVQHHDVHLGVIFILIDWPKGIVKNTEQAPAAK